MGKHTRYRPNTVNQLVAIYEGRLNKYDSARTINRLNKYIRGEMDHRGYSTYKEAAAIIIKKKLMASGLLPSDTTIQVVEEVVKESVYAPYRKLEEGQRLMMEAILEIAESEAQKRAEAQVAKLSKEFEAKEAQLETIIGEAKNSSVVGMLRKHFGN